MRPIAERLWRNTQAPAPDHLLEGPHGEQVQHPAIVGDVIYGNGFACKLGLEMAQEWQLQHTVHLRCLRLQPL
jgi:hypothetical protein